MAASTGGSGRAISAGLAHGFLLGAQLLIMRVIGDQAGSIALTWGMLLASNFIIAIWLTWTGQWSAVRHGLGRWRQWLCVGVTNGALTYLTMAGVHFSGAANAGILTRTDLLFGLLLAFVIYRERSHPVELAGGAIMLCGVFSVLGISLSDIHLQSIGDVYLLMAGLLLAVNAIIIKYGLRSLTGASIAFYNTLVASVFLTLVISCTGGWSQAIPLLGQSVALSVLAIGFMQAFALLTYYYALERFPVWIARSFGLITPIVALAGSTLFLAEELTARQVYGTVIALVGMAIIFIQRGRAAGQHVAAQPI